MRVLKDKLKGRISRVVGVVMLGTLLGVAIGVAPAFAEVECGASCAPWWHVNVAALPANLPPGGEGEISLVAEDYGDLPVRGPGPVVLTDKLPPGLTAQSINFTGTGLTGNYGEFFCVVLPREVTCTLPGPVAEVALPRAFSALQAEIKVTVAANASPAEVNTATISGGGAPTASTASSLAVDAAPPAFGPEGYEMRPENADGSPDTQAGSHPFQLTTNVGLKQLAGIKAPAAVKDVHVDLPPGLLGNPIPFPQCSLAKFTANAGAGKNLCPDDTVIGVASTTTIAHPIFGQNSEEFIRQTFESPLFTLAPSRGEPAKFGFDVLGVPVYLDTAIRTGGDYGVTVSVNNISELEGVVSSRVTFWGVPGDTRHDPVRGWDCLKPLGGDPPCVAAGGQASPPPLLTLPTSCAGPVRTTVEADSWQQQGVFTSPLEYTFLDNLGRAVGMDGCNQLPFSPSVKVTPDGQAGSTPTGLTVDEHVPQETSLNPTGLAESDVKGLSVTLPEGMVLNPAAADGLEACTQEEIALRSSEVSSCPDASKVATVKIKTPLLANPLEGAAYLATQDTNPFGSLVAMYLYAEDPVSGVRVKAAGEVLENPVTGQLTAHFEADPAFAGDQDTEFLPQTPFEDVELHFFGGDRAPLGTPAKCGGYTTTGSFTPWSGNPTTQSSSEFQIVSGPNGTACANPLPFAPSLTGGMTNIQAGGFSPLTTTISRSDGQQNIQQVQLHFPPGVSGVLAGVKLCGEPEANAGTCSPESQIGETIVSVGLGSDPFSVTGGKVYITGPYEGAPFGLSIVNPAVAGPFNLGQVIVRGKLELDRHTAALTFTSNTEAQGYAIPHILDGIPLQIQHINVTINRPRFTFNPTNCTPQAITGTIASAEGASSPVQVPFQVTNCAVLKFAPKFSVSTSGRTSKAFGASLTARLSYPNAPQDTQANITRVKVDLPKQLPSRLTTLQKACTNAQFELNPANCPAESKIGMAKVTTPLLPVPLEGPAIFVSHGGEAFPSLTMVLQGYGVTVDLVGTTFISKKGITSTTFKTVPDVPFSTFQLTLPQGKYSALAANGNLCKSQLAMPTEFVAQNGQKINQSTPVSVTGCAKAKALTRAQKLTQALKACHKDRSKTRRATCEHVASKRYTTTAKRKQKKK